VNHDAAPTECVESTLGGNAEERADDVEGGLVDRYGAAVDFDVVPGRVDAEQVDRPASP
jgi:hypothetical protein